MARKRYGPPHEATPVSKLEYGAVSFLTFDVRFGSWVCKNTVEIVQ